MGEDVGTSNAWMYHLLGDPQMEIQRDNQRIDIFGEDYLCKQAWCIIYLDIFRHDPLWDPVEYALVSIFKEGPNGEEVQMSGYADAKGQISFEFEAASAGKMLIAARDLMGSSAMIEMEIQW